MEGNFLITTDNFFFGPDGQQYRAAWGKVEILEDNLLGVKTNRNSTNWFAKVGNGDKEVIIAGCQIHYAVKCINRPSDGPWAREAIYEDRLVKHEYQSEIYFAQ